MDLLKPDSSLTHLDLRVKWSFSNFTYELNILNNFNRSHATHALMKQVKCQPQSWVTNATNIWEVLCKECGF